MGGNSRWDPKTEMVSWSSLSSHLTTPWRNQGEGRGIDLPKVTQWVSGGTGTRIPGLGCSLRQLRPPENIHLTIILPGWILRKLKLKEAS